MSHPDYKHRTLTESTNKVEDFDLMDLVNCVCLSVEQASAVATQMETQFLEGNGAVSDAANFSTLEVIRNELSDIKAVVEWYFNNSKGVKNDD